MQTSYARAPHKIYVYYILWKTHQVVRTEEIYMEYERGNLRLFRFELPVRGGGGGKKIPAETAVVLPTARQGERPPTIFRRRSTRARVVYRFLYTYINIIYVIFYILYIYITWRRDVNGIFNDILLSKYIYK